MKSLTATIIAILVLGAAIFAASHLFDLSTPARWFCSILGAALVGLFYVYLDHNHSEVLALLSSPRSAFMFSLSFALLIGLFFAGDCVVGFLSASTGVPLIEACTRHSGIGFPLTVGTAALLLGTLVVTWFRLLILKLLAHGV